MLKPGTRKGNCGMRDRNGISARHPSDPGEAPRLGEVLLEERVLSPEQIITVLVQQREPHPRPDRRFGEVAVDMRIATHAEIDAALQRQRRRS